MNYIIKNEHGNKFYVSKGGMINESQLDSMFENGELAKYLQEVST